MRIIYFLLLLYTGAAPAQTRRLLWSDEFSNTGLPDSTRWTYERGYVRNHELQYYTVARPQNAWVVGGHLHLMVRHDSAWVDGEHRPITSASLRSKARWTYGRMEVKAKFSSAKGTWPAIWTLGANLDTVGWPACGEIDLMEHVGYMPDSLHFTVHTQRYHHVMGTHKKARIHHPAPYNDFHVYAVEWTPERLDWYFDGRKVYSFANEGSGKEVWPFDAPQFLILNMAFGGDWGGVKGVDVGKLPQELVVDWVRVWE